MARTLFHNTEELIEFYQSMPPSVAGVEATSKATWFENLLFDNKHQMVIGKPSIIRKGAISRHKNDERDARHIFDLLIRDEFPTLWQRPQKSLDILDLQHLAHESGLAKGRMDSRLFRANLEAVEFGESFAFKRKTLFALWEEFSKKIVKLETCLQE